VGSEYSQTLIRGRKVNGGLMKDYHTPCVFVPLLGQYAWRRDPRRQA